MLGIALVLLWVLTWTSPVHAECVVDTDSPTFVDGKRIDLRCNASGELITSGAGGGGGGGAVQTLTIASGVTTNTTTAAVAGVSGNKTFWGEVICSAGACAQTQAIYGDQDNDAANGVLLCTLTLTDTARDQDACAGVTANYPYYYVVTTGTSGTSATGAVYANY